MIKRLTTKCLLLSNIDTTTRQIIWDQMSWDNGMMRTWMNNRNYVGLCLVYKDRSLIAWAAFSYDDYPCRDIISLGAWVNEKFRSQGIAKFAITECLDYFKVDKETPIEVWSYATERCVESLGFDPVGCYD